MADRSVHEFDAAVGLLLERLEREPDETALSRLLHTEVNGQRLTHQEIASNVKLSLVGGMQEPRDLIGLTTWALLTHPAQGAAVTADATLLKPAIEEVLRCYAPVGTATRQVTRPTVLAGVPLERGALVGAVLASANRDERHWRDPERFDLHRAEGPHLAFAAGPHFCLGAWLGRQIAGMGIQLLLARLPNLRLAPGAPATFHGWEFRGLRRLHVQWDS